MKTIGEILQLAHEFLKKKNILSPRRSAEELLAFVLGCKRMDLYLRFDQPVNEKETDLMREFLKRRALHEPVEYITGKLDFFGADLIVNKDVLIPRQETEIMLDIISKQYGEHFQEDKKILDLCTGSGCLAIAIKKKFPKSQMFASDISSSALKVASANADKNEVEIKFFQSNLFESLASHRFDFILCNPPYVSSKELQELDADVKHYEPRIALWGGEDGLDFYRKIAEIAPGYLNPGAKLFFEIGHAQGESVKTLFDSACWRVQKVLQDWSGKDRFFFLEFE